MRSLIKKLEEYKPDKMKVQDMTSGYVLITLIKGDLTIFIEEHSYPEGDYYFLNIYKGKEHQVDFDGDEEELINFLDKEL